MKSTIHYKFIQQAKSAGSAIRTCAELAERNRDIFAKARRQGKRCREEAVWIGLEE